MDPEAMPDEAMEPEAMTDPPAPWRCPKCRATNETIITKGSVATATCSSCGHETFVRSALMATEQAAASRTSQRLSLATTERL
jgi:hypothetical protein